MSPTRALLLVLVLVLPVLCTGCSTLSRWWTGSPTQLPVIENPLTTLEEVSITAVLAPPAYRDKEWTGTLRAALLGVDGVRKVSVVPYEGSYDGARDALPQLEGGSQALLQVEVLSFDPYYPPKAVVEVNFYVPRRVREVITDSVLTLDRHGSPPRRVRTGPSTPWIRFQQSFDLANAEISRSAARYSTHLGDANRGMAPLARVTRDADRYMEFVFYETLKECFSKIVTKEEETDGFLRKFLAGPAE